MKGKKEKKKRKGLGTGLKIAIVLVILIVGLFIALNEFYINILWFTEVDYLQVFLKELTTKLYMGVPVFLVLFLILSVYYKLLSRSGSKNSLIVETDKKGFVKGKLPFLLAFAVSLFTSILITSNLWYKWLEFRNSSAFNQTDPLFGKDISFYVFRLPFYEGLLNVGYTFLFILAASTVIYSFVILALKSNESRRLELDNVELKGFFPQLWTTFRVQLSIFASLFFILFAVSMYFKRFGLLYESSGIVYGADYTDVHVLMPLYMTLAVLSLIVAMTTLYFGMKKKIKPFVITVAVLVAVNLGGYLVSVIVENYVVSPNEYSKQSEYIEDHITATRQAYGIDDVDVVSFDEEDSTITASDILSNTTTINNIPINDYLPALDTYNSLQGIRPYYEFTDVDVDRYYIDGVYTQVFISARELNNYNLDESAQTWINMHLKYTHGFGLVISPVNAVNSSGQPVLIAKDIPTETDYSELEIDQERIYFGEDTDTYAVVNTVSKEFDYPDGSDNQENVYDGTAGIDLTLWNKISFSLSNGTLKFLLSSDVTSDSKIIINRNIMERVQEIAPFLTYDSDPYVVVIDGKIYWIVDALTTTDLYPYSEPYSEGSYNYIRNSVKVVVDAYNGTVTYYIVDEDDPIAETYSKIYPDLFKSYDEMPEEFKEHLRYSEAYFTVQAEMYNTYHMTNTSVFYNKEDVWEVATQYYQSSSDAVDVNPAYLIMKLPDREEEFLLMIPYTPQNKDNMVAWMAGICDGDDYGKLIVYEFSKQNLVYGPMQIEQRIDQDTVISPQLTLLSQEGSEVLRGNLLTIPIGDGLLYVEPIYIQASGSGSSIPEVKKVIVCYEDSIVMDDTIGGALAQLFGSDVSDTDTGDDTSTIDGTEADLITQAYDLYTKAVDAAQSGDWASYGEYIEELGNILEQLDGEE
jgi:uncharacterized membrane protein (UPF0182 family)